MKKISLILIVTLILFKHLSAQEIPLLKDVKMVSYTAIKNNLYYYSFKLSNPLSNTGQISSIKMDIEKPSNGIDLSGQDLRIEAGVDYRGNMMAVSFADAISELGIKLSKQLVPAGAKPVKGWSAGISSDGTIIWGSQDTQYRILPGQSSGEYVVISRGLPSIRNVIVAPKWITTTKGYVSEEDIERNKKVKKDIAYYGKTVGPTAPPANFIPTAFLGYIIDLKHQAVSLGWIDNSGIVNSLDVKLDNAKKRLGDGQPGAARNILGAFINEVEAQGCATYENCPAGKHLTSEAYALLKYNAQYLIDNLK